MWIFFNSARWNFESQEKGPPVKAGRASGNSGAFNLGQQPSQHNNNLQILTETSILFNSARGNAESCQEPRPEAPSANARRVYI
jgi:hypothetical protein